MLPLFRQLIRITAIFKITTLHTVYVEQCKKGNYLKLEHKHNQELTAYRLVKKKTDEHLTILLVTSNCFIRKRDVFMGVAISVVCFAQASMLKGQP